MIKGNNKGQGIDKSRQFGIGIAKREINLCKLAVAGLIGKRSVLDALAVWQLHVDLGAYVIRGKIKGLSACKKLAVLGDNGACTVCRVGGGFASACVTEEVCAMILIGQILRFVIQFTITSRDLGSCCCAADQGRSGCAKIANIARTYAHADLKLGHVGAGKNRVIAEIADLHAVAKGIERVSRIAKLCKVSGRICRGNNAKQRARAAYCGTVVQLAV